MRWRRAEPGSIEGGTVEQAQQPGKPIIDLRKVCMAFAKPSGEPMAVLNRHRCHAARGGNSWSPRPVGLRKIDAAANCRRAYPADLRRGRLSRRGLARPVRRDRSGVPDLRALPLAHRDRECRSRSRCTGLAERGGETARKDRDRADRPRRVRGSLSARAVGRHAPARRICARDRDRPDCAADGRAVLGIGRADGRDVAHRFPRSLDRTPDADEVGPAGDAQYRGSGDDVRPRSVLAANPGHIAAELAVPLPHPREPPGCRIPRYRGRDLFDPHGARSDGHRHGACRPRRAGAAPAAGDGQPGQRASGEAACRAL